MKRGLCKAVSEDCWTDSDELHVTDSTLNEGTNSLINEQIRAGRMVCHALLQNKRHKIHNGCTQEWWSLFTPLWVCILILYT